MVMSCIATGKRFWRGMRQLKRPVVTLWVINRDYDSVLQLRAYMDLADEIAPVKEKHRHRLHVVKNLAKSEDERFPTYDASEVKRRVENAGGLSVEFPIMALRNKERLYDKRQTIREILDSAPFGDRVEMLCWVEEMESALGALIDE